MNRKEAETCTLLKQYSEEFDVPLKEIIIGIMEGSLYVWHYNEGRAQQEIFKTLKIVPITTQNI